jgi:hypothetical protein
VCNGNRFGGPLPDTPGAASAGDDAPSVDAAEDVPTTPAASKCVDNPVWEDTEEKKCSDYEKSWCSEEANEYEKNGITGNTACCVCKDSCVDDTTWKDADGDGCSEYTANWCGDDAVKHAKDGIDANMACCICKK